MSTSITVVQRHDYLVSSDPARLDVDATHSRLQLLDHMEVAGPSVYRGLVSGR